MTRLLLRKIKLPGLLVIMGLALFLPAVSLAGGPIWGAKSSAMGTAFVAIADDPSAIAHNPAGMATQKGTNLYGGPVVVVPSSEFVSPAGVKEKTKFQAFFPPQLYLSSDLGMESVVLGLGLYSPFGIGGRKWSDTGLTRFAATEGTIGTVSANPSLAWRIIDQVAVGAGFDIVYAANSAENMVNQSLLRAADGRFTFKGWGVGVGYNLGLLLFPGKKVSLAFTYRSGVRVKQEGTFTFDGIAPALQPLFGTGKFTTHAATVVHFPQIFSWGVALRPTPKLTLGLEVEFGTWSSFDRTGLNLKDKVPQARLGNIPLDFRWEDAWLFEFGLEYRLNDRWAVRGGYVFATTPVPGRTLNPSNPDSDQHSICAGFGYKFRQWDIDFFYIADFFHDRKINNAILSGEYRNFMQMGGFSLGFKF